MRFSLVLLFLATSLAQNQWTGLYEQANACPMGCCCVTSVYAFQQGVDVSLSNVMLGGGCGGSGPNMDFQLKDPAGVDAYVTFQGQQVRLHLDGKKVTTTNKSAPNCNSTLIQTPTVTWSFPKQDMNVESSYVFCWDKLPTADMQLGWSVNASFQSVDNDQYSASLSIYRSSDDCLNLVDGVCVNCNNSYSGNFAQTLQQRSSWVASLNDVYEAVGLVFTCNNAVEYCQLMLNSAQLTLNQRINMVDKVSVTLGQVKTHRKGQKNRHHKIQIR